MKTEIIPNLESIPKNVVRFAFISRLPNEYSLLLIKEIETKTRINVLNLQIKERQYYLLRWAIQYYLCKQIRPTDVAIVFKHNLQRVSKNTRLFYERLNFKQSRDECRYYLNLIKQADESINYFDAIQKYSVKFECETNN